MVLRRTTIDVRDARPSPWRMHFAIAVALMLAVEVYLLYITPSFVLYPWVGTLVGLQATLAVDRGRRIVEDLIRPPSIEQVACAVADALHATGLSPLGSEAVIAVDDHACTMVGVDDSVRQAFTTALAEALSPGAASPYVVRRWLPRGPADNAAGLRVAFGWLQPEAEEWHSVPTVLASTEERAQAFARAWDHWVGGDPTVHTHRPDEKSGRRGELATAG